MTRLEATKKKKKESTYLFALLEISDRVRVKARASNADFQSRQIELSLLEHWLNLNLSNITSVISS